jgi:cytoskeleton protein RodZ
MVDGVPAAGPDASRTPQTAGERLRAAREAQGLSLDDIAARTRVPIRHLQAIESGDYSEMPTPTYAIGFAKAYARAVGEDEVGIAREVRGTTATISAQRQQYEPYELDDPTRVPPRGVALIAGLIAVVLLVVAVVWLGSSWFGGTADESAPAAQQAAAPTQPQPQPTAAVPVINNRGHVTLTALARVWVRVHDGSGKTLFQGTMNTGDHYDVPTDASHPQLTVGRPDQLQVTVDGTNIPPLGSGARPMKDVPIDAAALAIRAQAAATAAPGTATPAAAVAPTPTPTPTPGATATHRATVPAAKASPKAKPTPSPSPSKKLNLDLNPAPPPLPTTNGIY